MHSLTIRQEKFAHAYVELDNASAAYRLAYGQHNMSPACLASTAAQLKRNPRVAPLIEQLRRQRLEAFRASLTEAR